MRIAINGRLLIKNRLEGIGYFSWEVLNKMVSLYPEHDYLVLFDRKPAEEFLIPGVEFKILRPAARHPILYRLWFDILIPWHLRSWDAEVFLTFDGFSSQYLKIPQVTTIHDLAYLHFPAYMKSADLYYYQKYQPRFARLSDKILTVSHFSKTDIARQYRIDEKMIEVVYNGSRFEKQTPENNPSVLEQYGLKPKEYFIYTGSIHPRKNITRLVQAFEQTEAATKRNMKLVLAGRPAWKTESLMDLINQSPISSQIIRTGYIPDETLWNLLKNALSLCYISLFEGFGVPVLDSFHAGVPVICSGTTSLKEIAGNAALLVDPEDVEDISKAMDRLSHDTGLCRDLIDRGNAQKNKFNWTLTTQKIFSTVEDVYSKDG